MANRSSTFLIGIVIGALAGGGAVYLSQNAAPPKPREHRTGSAEAATPNQDVARQLANKTTIRFGTAINNRDLAGFRATTTAEFQQAFDLPSFEAAFKGFIDQQINLLAVADMQPVLTAHTTSNNGDSLHLAGYFPSQPSRLSFDYRYTRSGSNWVLSGIDVRVVPQ